MRSSRLDACCNTSWNMVFPPGPLAKLRPFFPIASGIVWECHSLRSTSPRAWKVLLLPSEIETEQLMRICFIIFLFLLLSPVNVIAKEQLLAFQWAPELLFIQSSEDVNGFFSWQHREDYTCIGLREKVVMPAVGVGSMTVKGVLETPLSLCTASKHGLDKDRSFWPAQLAQTWLEIQDIWSFLGISIRPDPRPLNKWENFLWPWLGFSGGKMLGKQAPLLFSSCESLHCWKHEHYLFGCLSGSWTPWVKSHPDPRCYALENVTPWCCLSKSPVMCLNWMQSMQSSFLIKEEFPLSLFLKSAVMSLLQLPMHSATVSKMRSDLMSTALGVTLLWSKAEQWE